MIQKLLCLRKFLALSLTFLLSLQTSFVAQADLAKDAPNGLLGPIYYQKNSPLPRKMYQGAKSGYCPSDPGYYREGSGSPPGGFGLFVVGGMCTVLTGGLCGIAYMGVAKGIKDSSVTSEKKEIQGQIEVIKSHMPAAQKVCADYRFDQLLNGKDVPEEWMTACELIGAVASGDAQMFSDLNGVAWTEVSRPYNLNSKITQWKLRQEQGVTDYPRYDTLKIVQLEVRFSGAKMCLSDLDTTQKILKNTHLTWKQATDLIYNNYLTYN